MNPRHHLHESTLMSYAAGALPAPLSVVAGTHLEQCPHCRQRLREAEAIGSVLLEQTQPPAPDPRREQLREAMLMQLAAEMPIAMDQAARPVPMERPEADPDHLPASLHPYFGASLSGLRWRWMAPGVHCIRAEQMPSLIMLKIAPGKCLRCTAMAAVN